MLAHAILDDSVVARRQQTMFGRQRSRDAGAGAGETRLSYIKRRGKMYNRYSRSASKGLFAEANKLYVESLEELAALHRRRVVALERLAVKDICVH